MKATSEISDADLVAASLQGNRDAFGQIVSRYQALVCSLTYSAVGRLGESEDLAQETFITAWKDLAHLNEPIKLRGWLCGIARNRINSFLRREGRRPLGNSEEFGVAHDSADHNAQPLEQTISREEEAILWQSLERIPETYREPLVLFYRQGQSVERVASSLELSEDAVKQRLSRGRKLLQEQVTAFVEGALQRSSPGRTFTIAVLSALPAFTMSAKAAAVGAAAAKGGGAAKAAMAGGLLGSFLSFPMAIFGNYLGYRMSMDQAHSDLEREFIKSFYRKLVFCILGFSAAFAALIFWGQPLLRARSHLFSVLLVGFAVAYALGMVAFSIWAMRARRTLIAVRKKQESGEASASARSRLRRKPAWEYRSKLELLGLPLVHIQIGGDFSAEKRIIKAWIAAGDAAVGGLFAFGGLAIAPISVGGCAIGLLPFGGMAIGVLALGGFAAGLCSFGGLAIGWQAYGGCAIAWNAAVGGAAVAHDFALGGFAQAAVANSKAAVEYIQPILFFRVSDVLIKYMAWLNLIWVVPMFFWWRTTARQARQTAAAL